MLHAIALAVLLTGAPAGRSHPDTVRAEEEIRLSVLRNAAEVRRCYEREGLRRNPSLAGTVEIELTILPTGEVDEVAITAASLE